jgi:hypothetical protein
MIIDIYKISKSQVKVCNQCDHELYPKGKIPWGTNLANVAKIEVNISILASPAILQF